MTIQQSHEARFGAGLDDEHAAAFNPAIGRMLDHRSCRLFEVEPVPDNLLHAVLSAAFSAPSKSDLQQRSVIRVRNREKLRRISRYSPAIGWISQAPVFLVWCGDSRRIRRLAEHRGHPFAPQSHHLHGRPPAPDLPGHAGAVRVARRLARQNHDSAEAGNTSSRLRRHQRAAGSEGAPEVPDDRQHDCEQDHEGGGGLPLPRVYPLALTATPNAYKRHGPRSVLRWPGRGRVHDVHPRP